MSDQDAGDEAGENHITLMTIHSAKGLEFKAVFVVGLEEELFPNQCALVSPREMEEERRLFYVAITRAQDYCILTHSKTRYHYGTTEYHEPSRFIDEIDEGCLSRSGNIATTQAQQRSGMFAAANRRGNMFAGQQRAAADGGSLFGGSRFSTPQQPATRVVDASSMGHPRLQRLSDVERDYSAPKSNHTPVSPGAIVQHDRFGVGMVQSVEGAGENAKAVINFKNAGTKTLLLKFAKLKTIG